MNPSGLSSNLTDDPDSLSKQLDEYTRYGPTLAGAALAFSSAAFVPVILLYIAWQIGPPYEKLTLKGSLCMSLLYTIPILMAVLIVNHSLARGGLAEKHLRWSTGICQALQCTTRKLIRYCIPSLVLYSTLEYYDGGKWNDSLGRICFLAGMSILAIGLWETSRKIKAHCNSQYDHGCKSDFTFWQRFLLGLIVIAPVALSILSAIGYHFTAVQLSWRLLWTLVILLGMALTTSFVGRLLLTTQFRMKLRYLNESNQDGNDVDIEAITTQVNRLLSVTAVAASVVIGWQIWSDVLPAIAYLDQYKFWESATSVAEFGVQRWVTLRDVLVSIGILVITLVLSRNLPGILEIVLLERLPLDRGGRYAISFVCRYLVGILGALLIFNWLGFSWTGVQWLVAGLTVGLGFGLQEIFANLVSGIIILIERPIRVGDFVTVNGVTGHVTQMRLRATTIKDLDYRELIVPNKKFITEDVMNWTLSDQTTRVVIQVGIAYGSDTKKAQQTLLDVANAHRLVKRIPRPEVVFVNFGESTLNFELRVMIATREVYYQVTHDLNMAIDSAFREAGVEIAFPQQDVHHHGLEGILEGRQVESGPKFPIQTESSKPDTATLRRAS